MYGEDNQLAVSVTVYIYFPEDTDDKTMQNLMSGMDWKRSMRQPYDWHYSSKWSLASDPGNVLKKFLHEEQKVLNKNLKTIRESIAVEADAHLIIGFADALRSELWPNITIDPASSKILWENNISVGIYLEEQVSRVQTGLA